MDIFINVRIRKRAVIQPIQFQMFILMLTSTCIFLITTLPLAIYKITSPRETNFGMSALKITTIWTALGWFQSLNYAVRIVLLINHSFYLSIP